MEKKYNPAEAEGQMREFWEKEDIYKFDKTREGEIYSIDTPPPTVSGSLHIGHIFSYTQAEMIARYKRMKGFNVFYPFGFDDNGLPSERLVEKEKGIFAKDKPRSEFTEICLSTVKKYEGEFRELYSSLGFSADWRLQYETINPNVIKLSQKLFLDLIKKGRAYSKDSPVLWCSECRTSIAQAELETKDIESSFNFIPFYAGDVPLIVATTRPELLFGCVCLFVNPGDERYSEFVGKSVRVPLYDYEIPVIADEKADMEKGTGAVMCATYGDFTDMEWAEKYSLPYRKVICPDGRIDENVPFIGGMKVNAARQKIIELLREKGLLIKSETITHTVGVHERCGKETEIIPSRQWYIDILKERDTFLKAADEINWYPSQMKDRYVAWVSNLKWDWCISRQRYFGIPFPVWYCKNCQKANFAKEEDLPVNPLERDFNGACECGCSEFLPERGVLDTWATSSVSPLINEMTSGIPLVPMGMRPQAHEIIRTWTFYTIVRSLYHTGNLPWKDIMISGFVLAKKGEKFSKSKANAGDELSPSNLIKNHSADALRYWAGSAKLGSDTFFSTDDLAVAKRFLTKLWNASRFAIGHLNDIDLSNKPGLLPVDRWIIARTDETIIKASKLLDEYEIGLARQEIDELFWKDFCDNYIEIAKERLYRPDLHGIEERKSGQFALYYTLLNILKLYAIYVPHITDYIYRQFFVGFEKEKSIHLSKWEKPECPESIILEFGETLKDAVFEVRKYKTENRLSLSAKIEVMTVKTTKELLPLFKESEFDLLACSGADRIEYVEG